MTPQEPAMGVSVDWLANVIRTVDGNHSLGAGALAEKIVEALAAIPHIQPAGEAVSTQPAPVDVRELREIVTLIDTEPSEAQRRLLALLSAQPSADAGDADEERLLGPWEEHFGRAYIDASCAEGVWTHPDHVFEFIEKRARELHDAAIAAQREAGAPALNCSLAREITENEMENQNARYPATCTAHWASGPVHCCDEHARQIVALGRFMGGHVPLTKLTEQAECANCVNEAGVNEKRD